MKTIKQGKLADVIHNLSEQAIRNQKIKLFNYFYIFKPAAPLKNFLQPKLTVMRDVYTLGGLVVI